MKLPYLLSAIFSCLLLVGGVYWLTADQQAAAHLVHPKPGNSELRFIENQGQWDDRINYKVRLNGGQILLEDQAMTYYFFDIPIPGHHNHGQHEPHGNEEGKAHVLRVHFEGSQIASIVPEIKYPKYHNYFIGNDARKWASRVPLYGLLTYRELYTQTDLRIYGHGDAVKYDFILKPGADPRQIQLRYDGADKIFLKGGDLHVHTSARNITESAPYAYQVINGQRVEVPCEYRLKKNHLSFRFPKGYDPQYELVIDPTLVFSTYSGSQSDSWGFTATYDDLGNAYAGGIEWQGGNGYPTTTGAIQPNAMGGEREVTIAKFDPTGTIQLYATYLGGTDADQPHSLVVNNNRELIIMGRTDSPNFPTTAGADDQSHNGGFDMFVAKFSEDGTILLGSTFLGGNADDGVNGDPSFGGNNLTKYNYGDDARGEVIVDDQGNIYVAGPTRSNNFPTTPGALQGSIGGFQDGSVTKFNPSLTNIIWCTYFGGSGDDATYSMKLDNQYNVYTAGGSSSTNLPTTGGVVSGSYNGGNTDGFIAIIASGGNALIRCTYLGTNNYDQIYFLELDENFNVYVCGQTRGSWQLVDPPSGLVYFNSGGKQFITKLNNNLSATIYSTVFGSIAATFPNISPTAFLVDRCENVYVTGWGGITNFQGSTNGMAVTADAYQSGTDGSDLYLIVLERDALGLLYATYLGGNNLVNPGSGEHVDGGTCRFDKEGVVYHAVCAQCGNPGTPFPTTNGSYSPNTGYTPNCNLAIFKMSFDLAGIEADFLPKDDNGDVIFQSEGCAPMTVNFDNLSVATNPATTSFFWDFDDMGSTSTLKDPVYTFQNPGVYTVMMIISDPTSCNLADTAFQTITVFEPPEADAGPDQLVCSGDTVDLSSLLPAETYHWAPNSLIFTSNTISNPSAVVTVNTEFILTVTDTNGCEGKDTIFVEIDDSFMVEARDDTVICRGGDSPLRATSNGGVSYHWSSNPPANITDPFSQNTDVQNLDTTTVFYVMSENALGCPAIDSFRLEVFEVFTLQDTFLCIGDTIELTSQGGVSFDWVPDDNSLNNTNISSPLAFPTSTTTYTVTAVSVDGCISSKSVEVEVKALPIATIEPIEPICFGFSTTLVADGGLTYSWSPVDGLALPNNDATLATPDVTTTYTVLVTDQFGCQDRESIEVIVNPLPDITAGPISSIICEGDSIPLLAAGGTSYEWTPGTSLTNPNASDPIAFPSNSTEYIVRGIDDNGCQNTDTVFVEVILRPQTHVEGENFKCVGGLIELTATGGDRYIWSTGDTAQIIEVDPPETTTYYATAFIGECEGYPDSITVDRFFEFPEASFTFSPERGWAPQTFQFTNTSVGAISYEWDFDWGLPSTEEHPSHIYPAAGEYTVTLIAYSATECPDTFSQTFFIDNVTLHVPSAFTPNGDDYNNHFMVGYVGIRSLHVDIYSRWGIKVYESDNKDFQWDGTYNGVQVPEGVYVYVIRGIGENELPYERSGTVTVFR